MEFSPKSTARMNGRPRRAGRERRNHRQSSRNSCCCIFPKGLDAKRLLLVGAGKPEKFAVGDLRKIAGTALRYLKSRGVKKFVFLAREGERGPAAAQAVIEGLLVADFESDKYRTEKKNNARFSPSRSPDSTTARAPTSPTLSSTAA